MASALTGNGLEPVARPRPGSPQPAPRRKRGQYANLACYECKKRKTKCNGNHPCGQCTKSGRECSFPARRPRGRGTTLESTETWRILKRLSDIEDRIRPSPVQPPEPTDLSGDGMQTPDQIQDTILGMPEATYDNVSPSRSSPLPPPQPQPHASSIAQHQHTEGAELSGDSSFSSPYSTTLNRASEGGSVSVYTPATAHYKFNIGLAKENLLARGVCPPPPASNVSEGVSRPASPPLQSACPDAADIDPLWLIDRLEAVRLCDVYEEEINISHPFLDMPTIRSNVNTLYDSIEVLRRHGCARISFKDSTILASDDLHIVKLVFATALITETSDPGSLARALFDNVRSSVNDKFWGDVTLPTIIIFFLLAMWQFLADNDRLAWRLTGFVARWCLEIGLNQSLFIRQVPGNDHDRRMAVRLFWCIHALDRRWSFGNGLPFVIQDSDIDKNYPEPDDQVPYLKAMVAFSHIMSAVWYASYGSPIDRSQAKGRDEASYLDFRITKWWEDLPADLQLGKHDDTYSRGMKRLRILLYLRRCQLKILLHQSILHSPQLIREHRRVADDLVQLAKDIIWKLDDLHRLTDIYATQQMCFNYFLVLSLGVIFLAISQAPEAFAHTLQAEFHAALDLVESLSVSSYISRRLWRFIRHLRPLGLRLGADKSTSVGEPHQNPGLPGETQITFEPELGLFPFSEDSFMSFQAFDETADTVQVMEMMKSIFEVVDADGGQRRA